MVITRITAEACTLRDIDTSHPDQINVSWNDIYLQEPLPYVCL
jgi:hypothetical protein